MSGAGERLPATPVEQFTTELDARTCCRETFRCESFKSIFSKLPAHNDLYIFAGMLPIHGTAICRTMLGLPLTQFCHPQDKDLLQGIISLRELQRHSLEAACSCMRPEGSPKLDFEAILFTALKPQFDETFSLTFHFSPLFVTKTRSPILLWP